MVDKKERIFKIIILFLFFVIGCSHKYVDVEGESLDEKVVASREELYCKIVEQDERGFTLSLEVRDVVVGDSIGEGNAWIVLGFLGGVGGCLGGCYYEVSNISWDGSGQEEFGRGVLISFASCVTGVGMIFAGIDRNRKSYRRKVAKTIPIFIKKDTVCINNVVLSKQKIKISIEESDFEKVYYTDKEGSVELKFNEILPKPKKTNFKFKVIIRYEDMVDSVNVDMLKDFMIDPMDAEMLKGTSH